MKINLEYKIQLNIFEWSAIIILFFWLLIILARQNNFYLQSSQFFIWLSLLFTSIYLLSPIVFIITFINIYKNYKKENRTLRDKFFLILNIINIFGVFIIHL